MKPQNEILKKALDYIDHSISIVPVGRNKVPYIKWEEFQTRRPTKEEVNGWWEKWPDANVAIVTGEISKITVVDVEAGGDISKLPKTNIVRSGGGGWHYYYQYHPIKSINRILPLTDIKSDGGLCTAPPSIHTNGNKYEVISRMLSTPFPAELFGEASQRSSGSDLSHLLNETISQGDRNNSATSICGKLLLRFKESEWELQAWPLFRAWNRTHNQPPLPENELLTIFKSISQAEQRRKKSGADVGEPQLLESGDKFVINVPITDGFAVFEFQEIEYSARSIDSLVRCFIEIPGTPSRAFVQRINILSSSAKESFARQLKESFVSSKKIAWPLIFSQACELLEKSVKTQSAEESYVESVGQDTNYLIRPFIEEGCSNIIFGKGGSGKTYLALRMAISLATGSDFLNIIPNKATNTIFVDYENTTQIWSHRLTRLLEGLGIQDKKSVQDKLFYFDTKGMPLHDLKYRLKESIMRRNIGLVIIDSAALACGGEPESAEVANRLFNAINSLKTTVLLIAHETKSTESKNKTPFGSIFFYNCARNIWNVENSQEQDESVINVGLFHRKSNNDRLSGPKVARIFFGEGLVDITPGDITPYAKELGLKKQILSELDEPMSLEDLSQNLGKDRNQIRVRLAELKNGGLVIKNDTGKWARNYSQNTSDNKNTIEDT